MTEFQDVVVALKQAENIEAYRFAVADSDSTRKVSSLTGDAFSVPVPIDILAYDPQRKSYLGLDRKGVSWRSNNAKTEDEDDLGTIGKAPITGAATFLDFFHGRFWCVGTEFQILSSEDGSKWEAQLDREGVDAKHHPGIWTSIIGAKNEEIYAVGLDGIIGVFDGVDWTLDRVDGINFWDAISIDADTIYACGSKGKLARRGDDEWEIISTRETDSFISFAKIGNQVYISTESKLFEFQIRGIHVKLKHVGEGGKLFVCDSTLFVLNTSKTLSEFKAVN